MAGPDLNAVNAKWNTSQAAPPGTGYADPSDLPVYTGEGIHLKTAGTKMLGRKTPWIGKGVTTKPQSKMEYDLYAKSPTELRELQKRLYAAGFYGGYDADKIVLGVPDEVTFKAWQTAVARASAYYQAGQKKTVDDVIDESAGILDQIYGKGGRRGGGGAGGDGGGRTRAPLTIGLTSPEDLRAVAQRTATATIGRALSDQEMAKFVASFHQAQATEQTGTYNIAEAGGTVTGAPSADVAAESFARQQAPTEAGGHDLLRTYQAFSNLLSRRG